MDPAQELMLSTLRRQKPMNDVIHRGDSPVQLFYHDATVFVTGGSGFIGKQLIEKLFRSCAIKKLYMLLRSKKGKTIQERLELMLSDPLYDLVREKQPLFADRIIPVKGDITEVNLGLSKEDWARLTQEVTAIFHAAATIRFDTPLQEATLTNVRGTRDSLKLARECFNLKSFVYVSTAYVTATEDNIAKDVYEKFYPSPVSPVLLISLAEELDDDKLNRMANEFIKGWPNTYIFTKIVAEELIRTTAMDLPICIVRPPIVVPAYYEPLPGWLDMSAITGTSGISLAVILGVLHVFRVDINSLLPKTPVDYVNNATIAAGWDAQQRRNVGDTDIPIYTVSSKDNFVTWNFKATILRNARIKMASDKAVYMNGLIECKNYYGYLVLSWLLHYIPAYILDACCAIIGKTPMGIKSFVGIYSKMDKIATLYNYFLSNWWGFRNDNVKAMIDRMSDADKAIYNCDLSTIDFSEYLLVAGLGIRKYIIKDGLNKSDLGSKKQIMFIILNYVLLSVYAYVIWLVLNLSFNVVKYFICMIMYW